MIIIFPFFHFYFFKTVTEFCTDWFVHLPGGGGRNCGKTGMGKIISFSGHGVVVVGMSWHVGSGLRGQGQAAKISGGEDHVLEVWFAPEGKGLVVMIYILPYTSIVMIGLALHHLSPTSLPLASYLRFCLFFFPVSFLSSTWFPLFPSTVSILFVTVGELSPWPSSWVYRGRNISCSD